ncbi:FCD domain-containing protein [Streptomyces sp. NPDC000618]|uniref:FadR/GntR family transcriptional regulator n=1 Tax=Streptomyces sp. NPDC000618 TaxID=3154265 RepID=UPI0033341212
MHLPRRSLRSRLPRRPCPESTSSCPVGGGASRIPAPAPRAWAADPDLVRGGRARRRCEAGRRHGPWRTAAGRLAPECGIAHLASAHASPGDLSELQDMVEEMDHMPSWAEFHGGDERFHLRLAQATGIPSNTEHRRLIDAPRRKDAAEAGEIARQHVEALHHTMFVGLMKD